MSGRPIPMATAAFLGSVVKPLATIGTPYDRLLEESSLSPAALEDERSIIPELALWQFESKAADTQGFDNLGYVAARDVSVASSGDFCGLILPRAATLADLLTWFSGHITVHSNFAAHYLRPLPDGARYQFDNTRLTGVLPWQVEQYLVGLITNLVRLSGDPHWVPGRLMLTNRRGHHAIHSDWEAAEIRWEQPVTGVFVPGDRLRARVSCDWQAGALDIPVPLPGYENEDDLKRLIKPYILSGTANLATIAGAFRLSPRQFQRRLAERHLRFRSIVNRTRLDLAKELLADSRQTVTQIADRLGYAHTGDFSVAFKRASGCSPGNFRASL